MKLTQRIADVAYKWINVNSVDLIKYKKSRERFEQLDISELEQFKQFSTMFYCSIRYINMVNVELVFGYRLKDKPDYFKKIIYEVIFDENDFKLNVVRDKLNQLVHKLNFCKCCDNLCLAEYEDDLCKHCYVYGTINEEDSCAICLTNDFGVWLVTSCDHKFHYKCYNQMPEKNCPLCRKATANDTTILDY